MDSRPSSLPLSHSGDDFPTRPREAHSPISLIKWTGTKRRQAAEIVARFSAEIATYHEPFLGGGSVLGRLLASPIRVGRYECSDSYAPLIGIWVLVKDDPERLIAGYARLWSAARTDGKTLYYEVRSSFNRTRCPVEFFYLLRTCRLGHVRINAEGRFTSAFDRSRAGVHPNRLRPVVEAWHRKLVAADVQFSVRDYREVASEPGDLIYLDPPYRTAKRYYGRTNFVEFFAWLGDQRASYLLSLGGHGGSEDHAAVVPAALYDDHLQVEAGDNPFHRLSGRARTPVVDSLYIRRGEGWVAQRATSDPDGADRGRAYGSRLESATRAGPRRPTRPRSEGMSAAIRSLLDANPHIKPIEVKRRLAERGMTISSALFRIVRMNWRRSQAHQADPAHGRS